jgi:hypothetical protein
MDFHVYVYGPAGGPLPRSFEAARAALEACGFYCEPDGSLGRGSVDPRPWQLVGTLFDADEWLQYVELRGWCPYPVWLEVLHAIGALPQTCALFLPASGTWLSESQFAARFELSVDVARG